MSGTKERFVDLLDSNPWLGDIASSAVWGEDHSPFSSAIFHVDSLQDLGLLQRFLESDAFVTGRRSAQARRRAEGLAPWNGWTRAMIELRNRTPREDPLFDTLWRATATVRYDAESGVPGRVNHGVLFSNMRFPGDLEFRGCTFDQFADFENCDVRGALLIKDCTFEDCSSWTQAGFGAGSRVVRSRFLDRSDFGGVQWGGSAEFKDVAFAGPVMFRKAEFSGVARFEDVSFSAGAGFHLVRFHGDLEMRRCVFREATSFQQSRFDGKTVFEDVTFAGPVHTEEADLDRILGKAGDEQVAKDLRARRRSRRDGAA